MWAHQITKNRFLHSELQPTRVFGSTYVSGETTSESFDRPILPTETFITSNRKKETLINTIKKRKRPASTLSWKERERESEREREREREREKERGSEREKEVFTSSPYGRDAPVHHPPPSCSQRNTSPTRVTRNEGPSSRRSL